MKVLADSRLQLTFGARSEHESLWVFLAHPVDDVNLLQRLSYCVFKLDVTRNVGRPKLQSNIEETRTLTNKDKYKSQ